MNSYREITYKYIRQNSKRTIFTMIGIILSLSLISGIGFLGYSFKDFMIERAKANGDYEFGIYGVNKEQINILKNDVDLYNFAVTQYAGTFKFQSGKENYVDISAEDENSINNVFKINLEEGDYPKKLNEITIDYRVKENYDVKLGEEINLDMINFEKEEVKTGEQKNFKVVGFIKEPYATGEYYSAKTFLDENSIEDASIFFYLKDRKDKVKKIEEKVEKLGISLENLYYNNDLLALTGESSMTGINDAFINMVIIVLTIVCVSTIFLIYNAINISVAERMNQFALLRSIGATPNQIKKLVFREGILLCFIGIPFGIIFGFLGVDITTKLLKNQIINIMSTYMNQSEAFRIRFYPSVIVLTLILGLVTILISCYGPARRAGNISPITVLKNNGASTGEKVKNYKGKLIKKIFGVEGWIAYKNIRRNSRRFIVTILSLSISLIMFVVFTTINIKRLEEMDYINKSSISQGRISVSRENYDDIEKELKNIANIGHIYKRGEFTSITPIKENRITKEFKDIYGSELYDFNVGNYIVNPSTSIQAYNVEALNAIGIEEKLEVNEIIIINNRSQYTSEGKLQNIPITNLKEGDTFSIPKASLDKSMDSYEVEEYKDIIKIDIANNNFYNFTVKKVIEKDVFQGDYNYELAIIINEDLYNSLDYYSYSRNNFYLTFKDGEADENIEVALEKVQNIADNYGEFFDNTYGYNKSIENMWLVINVFIYGFIVMITLIGIVNVMNTISLNILLKKKEFGSLGTIGMSKNQISKMIILEGALHGIISSVVGSVVAVGLIFLFIKVIGGGFSVSNNISIEPLVIGIIGIMTITIASAILPLRKINRISLVDGIRSEE